MVWASCPRRRHGLGVVARLRFDGSLPSPAPAFTLIELLTTVAALAILLGLMVSLARHVRERSEDNLTREILQRMDRLLDDYQARTGGLPVVTGLVNPDGSLPDEATLGQRAAKNNAEIVHTLRGELLRLPLPDPSLPAGRQPLGELPAGVFNEASLRDAWGHPIVYMPRGHAAVGMAEGDRPFFFSPGPDGRYLTRDDNLYSYETRR
jgi:type II secretory pathway pseudopilin PulG